MVAAAAVVAGNFEGPQLRTLLKDAVLNGGFGGLEGDCNVGVSRDIGWTSRARGHDTSRIRGAGARGRGEVQPD